MSEIDITMEWLPGRYAVCRFDPSASIPGWALAGGGFVSITHSERELSIVAAESIVPAEVKAERGWAAMRVVGKLDFSIVGLLAKLTGALAEAGIPCFAISTYDTDYILVKQQDADDAAEALGKVAQVTRRPEAAR
ncbi:MAG: ACT domain-containing protein [Planctomycetes bacterium]|nr:ACT domain-containing protein [Planctomycetota bacterium]